MRLTVGDIDAVTAFYRDAIGLRELGAEDGVTRLGVDGPLVELVSDPSAPPRPPRTTGLYHLAILVPSRADLARAIHRVTEANWRFTGASDHLVSEALYLTDPEGNGIELYRDRPREDWPSREGRVEMASEPLDLDAILSELRREEDGKPMPGGTRMGHVHLNVSEIEPTETFYSGGLGFDVTVRAYPGALFVSAGGYHHHIGLNTWSGQGAPPPPEGSRGMRHFEVLLPSQEALDAELSRLSSAGLEATPDGDGHRVADPSGNGVLLKVA